MQLRTMSHIGQELMNGYIMTSYDVAECNFIQGRINAFIQAGLPVPESLLNDSHRFMSIRIQYQQEMKAGKTNG